MQETTNCKLSFKSIPQNDHQPQTDLGKGLHILIF